MVDAPPLDSTLLRAAIGEGVSLGGVDGVYYGQELHMGDEIKMSLIRPIYVYITTPPLAPP